MAKKQKTKAKATSEPDAKYELTVAYRNALNAVDLCETFLWLTRVAKNKDKSGNEVASQVSSMMGSLKSLQYGRHGDDGVRRPVFNDDHVFPSDLAYHHIVEAANSLATQVLTDDRCYLSAHTCAVELSFVVDRWLRGLQLFHSWGFVDLGLRRGTVYEYMKTHLSFVNQDRLEGLAEYTECATSAFDAVGGLGFLRMRIEQERVEALRLCEGRGSLGDSGRGKASGVAYWLGDNRYRVNGADVVVSAVTQANVLQAVIELGGSCDTKQLSQRSGEPDPGRVLRAIAGSNSPLAPFVILPGGRNRGGYRVAIKKIETET